MLFLKIVNAFSVRCWVFVSTLADGTLILFKALIPNICKCSTDFKIKKKQNIDKLVS